MTTWNLTPADTIATYIALAGPGDIIHLGDGTYTQDVDFTSKNGSDGSPILLDATNDGGAVVRGQLVIDTASWIDVEGIFFDNSYAGATPQPGNAVVIVEDSNDINIKRVSARDTNAVGTYFIVFNFKDGNTDILFEDCAAYGKGRKGFSCSGGVSTNTGITLRRCFSYFQGSNELGEFYNHFSFYNAGGNLAENCVGFRAVGETQNIRGMLDGDGGNNSWYGNVIVDGNANCFHISGSSNGAWEHNVAINCDGNGLQIIDDGTPPSNNTVKNLSVIGEDANSDVYLVGIVSGVSTELSDSYMEEASGGFGININAGSGATIDNHDNRFFGMDGGDEYEGNASSGANEGFQDPGWDTATYGDGAYLIADTTALAGLGEGGNDVGATVIYRYEDGVLSSTALWPWPMEDRIFDELGVSVTWEADGGIWKTLAGVYAAAITVVIVVVVTVTVQA